MITVRRTDIRLHADAKRLIVKPLNLNNPARIEPVARFVMEMDDAAAEALLNQTLHEFEERHFDLKTTFAQHGEKAAAQLPERLTEVKKLLLGAYFTHEYSIQAAALFNPSIVPHPDQSGLPEGVLRFVLSLRAVGEGHISSLAFQIGTVDAQGRITLAPVSDRLTTGIYYETSTEEDYDVAFTPDIPLSARVLFPRAPSETNGIEDVRLTKFQDGQTSRYIGTFTAYNGRAIAPKLVETIDFQNFKVRALRGQAAADKGMALFPELVGGKYAMISRQNGRALFLMYSDDLYRWEEYQPLQQPRRAWEMLQMGNCGSPIKTDEGWLLLTHAVGPMRKYVLSLTLLDLHRPDRVIASLEQPLLSPNEEEREGYVPNVLYTCGMLAHGGWLIIPYAMSDSAISFALADVQEVLQALKP